MYVLSYGLAGVAAVGGIAFVAGMIISHRSNSPEAGLPFILMSFSAMVVAALVFLGTGLIQFGKLIKYAYNIFTRDDDRDDPDDK